MLYSIETDIFSSYVIGVHRKVLAQCRCFEKELGCTYYTTRIGGMAYLLHEDNVIEKQLALSKQDFYECVKRWCVSYKQKQVYIRCMYAHKWLFEFCDYLEKMNIRKMIEFYDFDNAKLFGNPLTIEEEKIYGNRIHKYFDYCVGYDNRTEYLGMKVIPMINGIDMSINPLSKAAYKQNDGSLTFLTIASLGYWQGLERLILGIKEYIKNIGEDSLIFYIVGDGPEYQYYEELIQQNELEQNVILVGPIYSNTELSVYYDTADVCVRSFGFYKRDNLN